MEDVPVSGERLISFLQEANKTLECKYPAVASYFNIHSSQLAVRMNVDLPSGWKKKNFLCLRCMTPWSRDKYRIELRPAVKPHKKIRLALRKLEEGRRCSLVEEKLALNHHSGNEIVLKCLVCHETTVFLINKKPKEDPALQDKKKNRKKKKKDLLSGLSPAVLDVVKTLNRPKVTGTTVGNTEHFYEDESLKTKEKTTKFQSLKVTPLGSKPAATLKNSAAPSFIPIGSSDRRPRKKGTKFLNPFALEEGGKSKKNKKKLDHLQKMIGDEETKPKKKSSSFRDFLTLV